MCADSASKQGQRITAAAAPKELSRGTAAGGGGGGGSRTPLQSGGESDRECEGGLGQLPGVTWGTASFLIFQLRGFVFVYVSGISASYCFHWRKERTCSREKASGAKLNPTHPESLGQGGPW